ncbi:XisH family protein [Desulfonema magnum]|uniref:XisH protein domain-conaining protein n=1 Tax=Desulfonema magnum TaxID=45655 RepID=A0A975BIM3_9BACT|nr:XisH family protein [Desulfonema magnum]QTA85809.1 XisH protein domain-conaining protein [Desulfonema magnum]
MTAKDIFHDVVRNALEKEEWIITDDPLFIRSLGIEFYIDLAAEKIIGAEKEGQKIAVEIKSFIAASAISEFHRALGQYMNYRLALQNQEPDRVLYLAVPKDTYETFFKIQFVQSAVREYRMEIAVYDPEKEEIVKWEI